MRFEGSMEVIHNLFRVQRLVAMGSPLQHNYRPVLFASTGIRRGVYAAGKARALERFQLTNTFAHVVGSSTGIAALQFFPSCQIAECIDLYWKEAASADFLNFRRLLKRGRPVEDTYFLSQKLEERLDRKKVQASPMGLWAGVTCATTGQGYLLNAKYDPEVVRASISVPGFCGDLVYLSGKPFLDAAGGSRMPMRQIVNKFNPTDLLIFANSSGVHPDRGLKKVITLASVRKLPRPVRQAFINRHHTTAEELEFLKQQSTCRWAIVWTDDQISDYESNPNKLMSAANRADAFVSALLEGAKAQVAGENIAAAE